VNLNRRNQAEQKGAQLLRRLRDEVLQDLLLHSTDSREVDTKAIAFVMIFLVWDASSQQQLLALRSVDYNIRR